MNKKFLALIVIGPPGSGKGTQVELLVKKFGFFHLISSEAGKEYIKTHHDSETLRQKQRYDQGLLFEPQWMFKVVKEKTEEMLKNGDKCKGIIFDGSPRTLYEAENLYKFLVEKVERKNIKIIEIDVSEDELRKRLAKRLICSQNSEHVFIKSEELKIGSPCPKGDGILEERDLDKKEVIDVRLEEYKNETVPGLEFLKQKHGIIKINGEQSIEDVHREIMQKLKI